jgi:hypothetical protein
MNNPGPPEQGNSPNIAGGIVLALLLFCSVGAILLFFIGPEKLREMISGISGTYSSQASAPFLSLSLFSGALTHLVLAMIAFITVLILTVKFQEPIMDLIDRRQLPNADLTQVTDEDVDTAEFYETELGEEFEFFVVPDQVQVFFFKAIPSIITAAISGLVASILISVFLSGLLEYIAIYFIYTIAFIVAAISYYGVEWARRNHNVLLFFTCNVIHLSSHGTGVIGFIIGKSADVSRDITPYSMNREPKMATDPRRLLNPDFKRDLLSLVYSIFGSLRGIRSLYLPSIFENASNLAVGLRWGDSILKIMGDLKEASVDLHEYIDDVNNKGDNILSGRAEDRSWNLGMAERKAKRFVESRTRHLTPQQKYNLINLRGVNPGRWNLKTGKKLVESQTVIVGETSFSSNDQSYRNLYNKSEELPGPTDIPSQQPGNTETPLHTRHDDEFSDPDGIPFLKKRD